MSEHATIVLDELDIAGLGEVLRDQSQSIGTRMRSVFFLRTRNGDDAVKELCDALKIKGDSVLLRHEIAYVLGQMQNFLAIETLENILRDTDDDPVVRHESAEAIAALGHVDSLGLLEDFSEDARPEVSETCKIATKRIKWIIENPDDPGDSDPEYISVDPAPALTESLTVDEAVAKMTDVKLPLFIRYQAMFLLRNMGSDEAIIGLTEGFKDSSALFRHEVAFVLGQMAHEASVPALTLRLEDREEHGMVRHEAAEALGAVGTQECIRLLELYAKDPEQIVAESCLTALDSIEYWKQFESFVQ